MANGVPETEVFAAADAVLARGERPTVERVRQELGRGSPARVGQLLEQWWEQLAQRLKGQALLPELPGEVAQAFTNTWRMALVHAGTAAHQALVEQHNDLFARETSLAQERKLWEIALAAAQADLAEETGKLAHIELQLAERQGLVDQLSSQVAEALAHHYLAQTSISDVLSVWLVGTLVSRQALRGDFESLDLLAEGNDKKISRITFNSPAVLETYFNNIAFAFAEMGDTQKAEKYLSNIINSVHKAAYPTATFGLIQFRKGRIDRATSLYEEAVRLSKTKGDKARIRQKMNLELGKFFTTINEMKARRWLDKVVSERHGEAELVKQASAIVQSLRPSKNNSSE